MKNNTLQPELVEKSLTKQEFLNNITIKKYSECKGRDGIAYSADIYYKGKLVCEIVEGGYGGELDINPYTKVGKDKYKFDNTIHAIFDTINKDDLHRVTTYKKEDGTFFSYTEDLESLLVTAVDLHCEEKVNQKIFKKGIIIESSKGSWEKEGAYRCITWANKSIKYLTNLSYMKPKVQKKITELLNQNKVIINKDYLISLGYSL